MSANQSNKIKNLKKLIDEADVENVGLQNKDMEWEDKYDIKT